MLESNSSNTAPTERLSITRDRNFASVSRVFSERINRVALSPNDDKRIILDEGIHKGALAAGDHVVGYRMAAPCWRASIQASIVKQSLLRGVKGDFSKGNEACLFSYSLHFSI